MVSKPSFVVSRSDSYNFTRPRVLECNLPRIVEIRHRKLVRYNGNFDACLEQKKAREEQHLAAYRAQQREIAHLEDFVRRFRAKASKAAQAQERIKRLERMERLDPPEADEATVSFRFPQPQRGGHRVIALEGVRQCYGNNVIYEHLDLEIERGQRTVLVGPNGAGKSTLLKILAANCRLRREAARQATIAALVISRSTGQTG